MKRWSVLGAVLAVTATVALAAPGPASASRGPCANEGVSIATASPVTLRASVLCLANAARLERGLLALQPDSRLDSAAQIHADDMVLRHFFAHDTPTGGTAAQRITAALYPWVTYGENIAQGQRTPAAVVDSWLRSTGHCRNLMTSGFRDLGIGANPGVGDLRYGPGMWVQVYGTTPDEETPPAVPGPAAACPLSLSTIGAGPAPTAGAGAVPAVSATSATLSAPVSPNGTFTSYHFVVGGESMPERAAGAADRATTVTDEIEDLAPSTTYTYRVVATNQSGEAIGPTQSFTTEPAPPPDPEEEGDEETGDDLPSPSTSIEIDPEPAPAAPVTRRAPAATATFGKRTSTRISVRLRLGDVGFGSARATLVRSGVTLAQASFRAGPDRTVTVRLKLTKRGRALARKRKTVSVQLRLSLPGGRRVTVGPKRMKL